MFTKADDKVHRLTDMVTEEVSLVDRPANRRKFIVVKGLQMNTGSAIIQGENGLTTAATVATTAVADGTAKAVLLADVKDTFVSVLEMVIAELDTTLKSAASATTTENPAEVVGMEKILNAVLDSSEYLEDVAYASQTFDTTQKAESSADKRFAVLSAKRVLLKSENSSAFASVIKRGAKMKKERHGKFMEALSILQHLASELAPASDTEKGKFPFKPKPKDEVEEPEDKKKPGFPPAKAKKVDGAPAVDPEIAALTAEVAKLTAQLKKNEETTAAARSTVATSNVAAADSIPVAKSDDVFWAMDLNYVTR